MKHAVTDEWMKRALFSDVHSPAQFFFQIDQQPPREPRRRARTGLDQQVEITVLARVTSREGTEHTHTLNAVSGRDGQDRGTLLRA